MDEAIKYVLRFPRTNVEYFGKALNLPENEAILLLDKARYIVRNLIKKDIRGMKTNCQMVLLFTQEIPQCNYDEFNAECTKRKVPMEIRQYLWDNKEALYFYLLTPLEQKLKTINESPKPKIQTNIIKENLILPEKKEIVISSDWHIPFHDPEVLKVYYNFYEDYQPDILILNGNINDCSAFSSHPKKKEVKEAFRTAREEREHWFRYADELRLLLPNTEIIYVGSECHEGWIEKWAALSDITWDDDNYTIPGWLKLKDFGIQFVPEEYIINKFTVIHGTICRKGAGSSARGEMEYNGTSGASGHVHKLSAIYFTDRVQNRVWFETGCACQRKPWYVIRGKRRLMDWQQGFILLSMEDNSFHGIPIPVIRNGKDEPYIKLGKYNKWTA